MSYPVRVLRCPPGSPRVLELRDASGNYLSRLQFGCDIENYSLGGDTITVTLEDGRTSLYDARNGRFLRNL